MPLLSAPNNNYLPASQTQTQALNNNWINTLYPGAPKNPGYSGLTDQNGNLLPQYALQNQGNILPQFQDLMNSKYGTALDALTSQATSTAPSAWANVAQQSNTANTANQMGNAGAQANSANAAANSALASHGGLRQGAMENLANQSQKSLLSTKQGILNTGFLNDLGIQSQDATNKMGMLQNAATGGLNAASLWNGVAQGDRSYNTGVQQANIGTAAQNNQNQNLFNANTYNQNMQAWAANNQANAQATAAQHSGGLFGGGGFLGLGSWICTEVNAAKKLPKEIVAELKKLKDSALEVAPGRTAFYLNGAGGLLGKLREQGYDFNQERPFVIAMAALHKTNPAAAVEAYWDRVNLLLKEQGI